MYVIDSEDMPNLVRIPTAYDECVEIQLLQQRTDICKVCHIWESRQVQWNVCGDITVLYTEICWQMVKQGEDVQQCRRCQCAVVQLSKVCEGRLKMLQSLFHIKNDFPNSDFESHRKSEIETSQRLWRTCEPQKRSLVCQTFSLQIKSHSFFILPQRMFGQLELQRP